jgi:hypothetical protein
MWLDDDEIRERLKRGEADAVAEALEAIDNRCGAGESLDLEPLDAAVLAPLASRADYRQTNLILSYLLGVGVPGMPALEGDAAFDEVARLVASHLPFETMHAAAMTLKVHPSPTDAVARVLSTLGDLLRHVGDDRVEPVEHFVSCLLDGSEEIRRVTSEAVKSWPISASTNAVRERLDIK